MSSQTLHLEQTLTTLGGRVTCQRCQAKSKRTKLQCAAPALKGKRVCKTHGGRSTGPKTEAGRQRCAEAKIIHGRETREARTERSLASARLAVLEEVGHKLGFMNGTKTRGRKPNRMFEGYSEFQKLFPTENPAANLAAQIVNKPVAPAAQPKATGYPSKIAANKLVWSMIQL